jgi:hypothetical protein
MSHESLQDTFKWLWHFVKCETAQVPRRPMSRGTGSASRIARSAGSCMSTDCLAFEILLKIQTLMPQTAKYHYAVNGQLQTKARRFRIPLLHEDTATCGLIKVFGPETQGPSRYGIP